MGCQSCVQRVQRHFLRNFFSQNHIDWHCERKNSAGFVKTALYFSGELLSKTILKVVDLFFFLVLAKFFKHGLPKLCSTWPEALFAELFFTESYWLTLWAKKFSWFCQNCIILFRATFVQNNSQSRRFGFFSSPCQILQAWVAKTVFYVFRGTFCWTFFTESYHLALWAKKFSWFSQNCILLFRGTFEQNNSRSRRFGFFSGPCQILQAWVAKTAFYVTRVTFCGIFCTKSY